MDEKYNARIICPYTTSNDIEGLGNGTSLINFNQQLEEQENKEEFIKNEALSLGLIDEI